MKLTTLSESEPSPEDPDTGPKYSKESNPWTVADENPGLTHGDACPTCGKRLTNRYHGGMGPPSAVGCMNLHAWPLKRKAKKVWDSKVADEIIARIDAQTARQQAETPQIPHTCRIDRRRPDDESWARRNKRYCGACEQEYEDDLDSGFIGEIPTELVEPEVDPGISKMNQLRDKVNNPRSHHVPGRFGTGRVQGLKGSDLHPMAIAKIYRDKDIPIDDVSGLGKRTDQRFNCAHGHTCKAGPPSKTGRSRPAHIFAIPDPVATRSSGKKIQKKLGIRPERFNSMFEYKPTATRRYPVSGMSGYVPKSEWEDYVESKLNCKACMGREGFGDPVDTCEKKVANEYGVEKPYCQDHIEEAPYPSQLKDTYGGEGLPDFPDDPATKTTRSTWVDDRSKSVGGAGSERRVDFEKGDKIVKVDVQGNPNKNWGEGGPLRGVIIDIDWDMADKTHKVKWENPLGGDEPADDSPGSKAAYENRKTGWMDPAELEVIYHTCQDLYNKQTDKDKGKCPGCRTGDPKPT